MVHGPRSVHLAEEFNGRAYIVVVVGEVVVTLKSLQGRTVVLLMKWPTLMYKEEAMLYL